MTPKIVPKDSVFRLWLEKLSVTEIPVSYQLLVGMSALGSLLKRSVFVDQVRWRVYPNLSVLLIGPSGIGKDLAINEAASLINTVDENLEVSGATIEYLKSELIKLGDPAACFTPAQELSAFLGAKDYQKGIAKELTDLLSTGDRVAVGTKSEGKKLIIRPTVTIQAGSTAEWLKDLPENSLEGGFLPRFLIMCEEYGQKFVAWVKYDNTKEDNDKATAAGEEFLAHVRAIVAEFGGRNIRAKEQEMMPLPDAEDYYRNWYCNRFKLFSPGVKAYANRSRDQIHRLAMIMALSRYHNYLEATDYAFAAEVMSKIAQGLDIVIAPMLKENSNKRMWR